MAKCEKCQSEMHGSGEHQSSTGGNWIGGKGGKDIRSAIEKTVPVSRIMQKGTEGYGKRTQARARFAQRLAGYHGSNRA